MSSTLRQTKYLREIKRSASKLGASIEEVTKQGHYHITLSRAGVRRLFIVSSTPGDVRGERNFKADVKRWVRQIDERNTKTEVHEADRAKPAAGQGNVPAAEGV